MRFIRLSTARSLEYLRGGSDDPPPHRSLGCVRAAPGSCCVGPRRGVARVARSPRGRLTGGTEKGRQTSETGCCSPDAASAAPTERPTKPTKPCSAGNRQQKQPVLPGARSRTASSAGRRCSRLAVDRADQPQACPALKSRRACYAGKVTAGCRTTNSGRAAHDQRRGGAERCSESRPSVHTNRLRSATAASRVSDGSPTQQARVSGTASHH